MRTQETLEGRVFVSFEKYRWQIFLGTACMLFSVFLGFPVSADDTRDTEEKRDKTAKDLKKAEKELNVMNSKLSSVNVSLNTAIAAIRKTQTAIDETEDVIVRKELEIRLTEQRIALKQDVLSDLVRETYLEREMSSVPVVLSDRTVSDVRESSTRLTDVGARIGEILEEMNALRNKRESEKLEYEELKAEKEAALAKKNAEKAGLAANKAEIAEEVAEQEATVEELRKKLAELEADLSTITGKSYNAKNIRDAVEHASDQTGVPRGVLYGFLKMETNLGANTGQCTYKQVKDVAIPRYKKYGSKYKSSIDLLYKREKLFYALVDDLGYSKSKKVSCSPSGYMGQGGAMGVPQFMSDIWNAYASQITAKTGHKTPDPWDLTDGVMAMAIKLRNAGATSDKASVIRKASINYLGTFHAPYYNGIVYWSKNYKRLFN